MDLGLKGSLTTFKITNTSHISSDEKVLKTTWERDVSTSLHSTYNVWQQSDSKWPRNPSVLTALWICDKNNHRYVLCSLIQTRSYCLSEGKWLFYWRRSFHTQKKACLSWKPPSFTRPIPFFGIKKLKKVSEKMLVRLFFPPAGRKCSLPSSCSHYSECINIKAKQKHEQYGNTLEER